MPARAAKHNTNDVATLLNDKFARLARQLRNLELPPGMTPERMSAMAAIEAEGPISVTALAEREIVRPATMSRMVSALVDDGLARRLEDKTDGRGVLVTATPKGRRLFHRAHEQRLKQLRDALGALSREQLTAMRALANALERLTAVLED